MNVLKNICNKLFYKSADDKLALFLLSHINASSKVEKGIRISDSYKVTVKDSIYECGYSWCNVNGIDFKSNLFIKVYDKLGSIYHANLTKKVQEDILKEKIKKSLEFKIALQTHCGIEKILDIIAEKNENAKFSKGKMYISDNFFIAHSPTDIEDTYNINSVVINLKTLDVTMHRSYGAFTTYKRFEGKLQNLDNIQKYIDIVNKQIKEEYKNKQEFIKAL
jgi:hypothetical protein